ncbi:MAP6 domain-containing protein 1 isoform X3 [Gallus gallus]|uniref:MAP6 domain-containing protein 1 isoform X3 n=1 Tax=Gallus gallus TaxID=9031 RepID=UPI001AEA1F96|nr:MAP6 domain-containing protein 1 isoform X3 [Gallus gallus]
MAWPCISRVCCLARFWSQLDRSDLAVPLTIRNYSDIEEQEDAPAPPPPPPPPRPPAAAPRPRPGPAHGSPPEPFAAETQYRRDFRAWPLPRRAARPWVSAGSGGHRPPAPPPAPTRAARALPGIGRPERRPRADGGPTTSYRQEYRPWTGAKPSKPIKTKQGFIIPDDHFVQETSYKADYKAPSRILNV